MSGNPGGCQGANLRAECLAVLEIEMFLLQFAEVVFSFSPKSYSRTLDDSIRNLGVESENQNECRRITWM
jgi:hypothetical protein